jgi:hypothetical protein
MVTWRIFELLFLCASTVSYEMVTVIKALEEVQYVTDEKSCDLDFDPSIWRPIGYVSSSCCVSVHWSSIHGQITSPDRPVSYMGRHNLDPDMVNFYLLHCHHKDMKR